VLKAYFDGSGKTENDDPVITLAGFGTSGPLWPTVESAWMAALYEMRGWPLNLSALYEDRPHWHTGDAHYRLSRDDFALAVWHLFKSISTFRPQRLIAYSASVVLADYERAKREITLRAPEALCVDGALGSLAPMTDEDIPMLVHFDNNEEFLKHVHPVWQQRKRRFRHEGLKDWSLQIQKIIPVSAREYYPVEMADLFAWIIRKHHSITRGLVVATEAERALVDSWAVASLLSVNHVQKLFEYDAIISRYGQP
jgi:hypothetical protein